jgi:hypothetical protein
MKKREQVVDADVDIDVDVQVVAHPLKNRDSM